MARRTFFCIDGHTCGNPVRVVASGIPPLRGKSIFEKREHFLQEYDWIRQGLMFEPRGHEQMSGSFIFPPENPDNDAGILFIETSGCLPMCGHGTIGTVTIAIEEGLIFPKTPGTLRLETPAGLVIANYTQNEKKKIVIIGAGTIGLHCAYFLNLSGHEVEIIEAASETDISGCSHGNCGLIVPSHFVPLASPGMLKSGIKMMFDAKSPFSLPVLKNLGQIPWFLKFMKAATRENVRRSALPLFSLNEESKKLYREIYSQCPENLEWQENGLLMTCTTPDGFEEEIMISKMASELGIVTKILDAGGLKNMEPDVKFNVSGAVWYECDAHMQPVKYMEWLKNFLKGEGVRIHYQSRIINLKTQNGKIVQAQTDTAGFTADEFVLAAGILSKELAENIGLSLPLISGKGYSIDFPGSLTNLKTPVILCEARVALTPFANSLRLGSGMELNGKTGRINKRRVQEMLDQTHYALPDFPKAETGNLKIWEGLRPVTPDGVPLIGRTKQIKNLLIAAGHAMMGVSLAPITGKIINDLVEGKRVDLFGEIYRLNRF